MKALRNSVQCRRLIFMGEDGQVKVQTLIAG